MYLISLFIISIVTFVKHLVGIAHKPYETYRQITNNPKLFELLYIGLCCLVYFSFVSLIRIPEFRLYVLTREVVLLTLGALAGYMAMVVAMWSGGLLFGGKGTILRVAVSWGYTLIPTVLWFLVTSLLYIVFPPPRTESIRGVSFSLLYLVISSILLFWKIELYYLSLRFAMRMSLKGIIMTGILTIPVIIGYTIGMYKVGIFKVPFI